MDSLNFWQVHFCPVHIGLSETDIFPSLSRDAAGVSNPGGLALRIVKKNREYGPTFAKGGISKEPAVYYVRKWRFISTWWKHPIQGCPKRGFSMRMSHYFYDLTHFRGEGRNTEIISLVLRFKWRHSNSILKLSIWPLAVYHFVRSHVQKNIVLAFCVELVLCHMIYSLHQLKPKTKTKN